MNASQAFDRVYNGDRNFMTPDLVAYVTTDDLFIEISSGTGFDREPLFGVTVLEREGLKKRSDLNKLCFSEREARDYAEGLS